MKKRFTITDETFPAVMDELSRKAGKILEKLPEREERQAFLTFFDTLSTLADKRFKYWPEEDKQDLLAFCGTWMNVGILMGKSPGVLADILKKTSLRMEGL